MIVCPISRCLKRAIQARDFLALRDALPSYLKGLVAFACKTDWRVSEISGQPGTGLTAEKELAGLKLKKTKMMVPEHLTLTMN